MITTLPASKATVDKENLDAGLSGIIRNSQSQDTISLQSSQKSAKDACREYPRTPVGRVPLADLINCSEDGDKSPVRSPIERVAWNHSPRSSDEPFSYMTPAKRSGKKRARSSSPISSQKNTSTSKPTFDLQTLQTSLKTPQIDPAVDLENRYFSRVKHNTPTRPPASAAADFMHSSSPQTPVLNSSETAKLRRTMSCGVQWPNTNKRRKTSKGRHVLGGGSVLSTKVNVDNKEATTWNFLLDQIQGDLDASTNPAPADATSSSPLPKVSTPTKRRRSSKELVRPGMVETTKMLGSFHPPGDEVTLLEGDLTSSEFGDDDIDFAMLKEIDMVSTKDETAQTSVNKSEINRAHNIIMEEINNESQIRLNDDLRTETANEMLSGQHQPHHTSRNIEISNDIGRGLDVDAYDEFDDGGDDVFDDEFAADLEDVVKMYDEQPSRIIDPTGQKPLRAMDDNPHKNGSTGPKKAEVISPVEVSSDEEFEEGIDFAELVDEIERSTQANGAASSVRTVYQSPSS